MRRREFLAGMAGGVAVGSLAKGLPAAGQRTPESGAGGAKPGSVSLNVREYGATGDGKTKDTVALQNTIERCSLFGGGEVVVPAGDYLTGALALRSNVRLRVEEGASLLGSPDMADYPLAQVRWEGRFIKGYMGLIYANDAQGIGISGPGKIVGSPEVKGRVDRATGLRLPALMEFTNCKGVTVENCYTQNYGMWSIHPLFCDDVTFRKVRVVSGADGIDVDSCRHVVIDNCDFTTTDDCISLKSGRGEEALTIGRPTEDVRITNCTFDDKTWACIGIGSETSAGIRGVVVEHCKCVGARTFAVYIKSRPGRGAFIEDISMNDLDVSGAQQGFLRFNILNSGKQDEFPVPGVAGIPTIRNFRFSNIRVKDVPVLVDGGSIHPDKPLEGFVLEHVSGTCGKGISLANVKHAEVRDVHVTGFSGPLLMTRNVTGKGLEGAQPLPDAALPEPVPEPATPYKLH